MSDDDLEQMRYALRRIDEHQEEQTDALDRVADQLEIQNAVLFEAVRALQRQNRIAMGRDPDDVPSPTSLASMVEDGALHLAEGVDLEAAQRCADE
jgi:hypothetical protein